MGTSIVEYMNQSRVNLEKTLGGRTDQFITSVASLYNSSDKLQECDQKSVMLACLTASSLNLPINQNLGFAYIIPYNDKHKGKVAQFQMGYKGFIQLAQRSGQFRTINATDVREGELASHDRLTGTMKFEWSDDREKLKTVGYVAYMELTNGFNKSLYMTMDELKAHGLKYSKTMVRGYGLWKDDFDAMAKKTVIKLLLSRYAPMTTEMQTATLSDQSIVTDDGYEYVDNGVITPDEIAEQKEDMKIKKHIKEAKNIEDLVKVEKYAVTDEQKKLYADKLDSLEEAK